MLAVLVLVVPVPAFLQAAALAVLAIDLAGIAVLVALVAAPARCARLIERLSARWPRLRQRALSVFETFVRGLDGIRAPSHALPILLWTAILWVIPAAAALLSPSAPGEAARPAQSVGGLTPGATRRRPSCHHPLQARPRGRRSRWVA